MTPLPPNHCHPPALEHAARTFSHAWKPALARIATDAGSGFLDPETGTAVLKMGLTQLLLYYSRFLEIVKHAYGRF
jgi:hypothetical protein